MDRHFDEAVETALSALRPGKGHSVVVVVPDHDYDTVDATDIRDEYENDESVEASFSITARQDAMWSGYESVVREFGPFDRGTGPDGAHYAPGDKNPFVAEGLMCSNCVFYADAYCEMLAGDVDAEGVCKLWIIPDGERAENG